jgi:Ca2+-binding RTX toxin-like protein
MTLKTAAHLIAEANARIANLPLPAVAELAGGTPREVRDSRHTNAHAPVHTNNDRRPTMNRIDITLRAATRRALIIGLLAALLLALGAAAPAVLAAITCPGGSCLGTDSDDTLQGTAGIDRISGRGGADTITGGKGNDQLDGDGQLDVGLDGADTISGGDGNDDLTGFGGADLLIGGRGADIIFTGEFADHPAGVDTVRGGRGNDTIYANDDVKDKIDCGPGRDFVQFDQGLDTLTNCEDKLPD